MSDKLTKVWFNLNPDDWHGCPAETLWAEPVRRDGDAVALRLQNSPFHARGVSYLDLVRAKISGTPSRFEFDRVIEHSGHSTFMLLVPNDSEKFSAYAAELKKMGCSYENAGSDPGWKGETLYSVDVPDTTDIDTVYLILEAGTQDHVWEWEEGHVGHEVTGT